MNGAARSINTEKVLIMKPSLDTVRRSTRMPSRFMLSLRMWENRESTASRDEVDERTMAFTMLNSSVCRALRVLRNAFDDASTASLDSSEGLAKYAFPTCGYWRLASVCAAACTKDYSRRHQQNSRVAGVALEALQSRRCWQEHRPDTS